MTNFKENKVAETKATFAEAVAKKNNKPTGPKSEKAKYEVSKNAIKNGFSSKRFIIYGENVKEFEEYRDGMIDFLEPINAIHLDMCFQIILSGWNSKRLNSAKNGVYNLEAKLALENSYNVENIHTKNNKQVNKIIKHHNKDSQVLGLIFARDCAGENVIASITELEQKTLARYHKILNHILFIDLERGKKYEQ